MIANPLDISKPGAHPNPTSRLAYASPSEAEAYVGSQQQDNILQARCKRNRCVATNMWLRFDLVADDKKNGRLQA